MHFFSSQNCLASVLLVLSFSVGCEFRENNPAAVPYDSASQRYGTSITSQDVSIETTSETPSNQPAVTIPPVATGNEVDNSMNSSGVDTNSTGNSTATDRGIHEFASTATSPPAGHNAVNNAVVATNAPLEEPVTQLQHANGRDREEWRDDVPRTNTHEANRQSSHSASPRDIHAVDSTANTSSPSPEFIRYARKTLNRLITRYKRARTAMQRSEASYQIDHDVTLLKSFEFFVRDTPQSFNTLPERNTYIFRDFQEAADDLVPELEYYLQEIATENEKNELLPLLEEAVKVTAMTPPGTGNRVLDFLHSFKQTIEKNPNE